MACGNTLENYELLYEMANFKLWAVFAQCLLIPYETVTLLWAVYTILWICKLIHLVLKCNVKIRA